MAGKRKRVKIYWASILLCSMLAILQLSLIPITDEETEVQKNKTISQSYIAKKI